jgi:membrane protein implicated in regulation of membrane protease activity
MNHWITLAVIAGWMAIWGSRGDPIATGVLLHWPVAGILVIGFKYDIKGGLFAGLGAAILIMAFRLTGVINDWTLVGWQFLVFGFFALYPYKFMQIRTQRRSHFGILTEYKRSEIESLKRKLADLDRKCRDIEQRLR